MRRMQDWSLLFNDAQARGWRFANFICHRGISISSDWSRGWDNALGKHGEAIFPRARLNADWALCSQTTQLQKRVCTKCLSKYTNAKRSVVGRHLRTGQNGSICEVSCLPRAVWLKIELGFLPCLKFIFWCLKSGHLGSWGKFEASWGGLLPPRNSCRSPIGPQLGLTSYL